MLSRRWLRVKVLQQIYRLEQANDLPLADLEKALDFQLQALFQQFYFNCYLFYKTADYAHTDMDIRNKKHLPTADDKFVSIKIADNPFINGLYNTEPMSNFLKKQKPEQFVDKDMLRKWFLEMRGMQEYRNYAAKQDATLEEEYKMATMLYGSVIYKSNPNTTQTTTKDTNAARIKQRTEQEGQLEILSDYHQLMEDLFPDWLDNCELVSRQMEASIKGMLENPSEPILMPVYNPKDDKVKFAQKLLKDYYRLHEELTDYVSPQLKNWETDRLNLIDMILLKLGVCELINEPEIPVKVTFNEYIEIAKLYSTPESHKFINGVLDRTFVKLQETGRVHKTGRGLVQETEKK